MTDNALLLLKFINTVIMSGSFNIAVTLDIAVN